MCIRDRADMAVARFPDLSPTKRTGFGVVKLTAYCGVRQLCGRKMSAILSGQRAARRSTFLSLMPFAPGFGVEIGLTIDAVSYTHLDVYKRQLLRCKTF